jgi:Na+:H+ antiporter, NhaA family
MIWAGSELQWRQVMSETTPTKPARNTTLISVVKNFLQLESASGILLVLAAIVALLLANSPLAHWYAALLDTPVAIQVGAFAIHKPLLLWINDGLMAIFFFLVGMELKREVLEGELRHKEQILLPAVAALGGMLVPAIVYSVFNYSQGEAMRGWAIPTATDIAFALGVLSLLGSRVPTTLKIFLMTLAIFDDVGAIVIIAIFYTSELSTTAMLVASGALAILFIMNRKRVMRIAAYLIVGLILWASVLKSGVHATLAGAALALFIPMRNPSQSEHSPLREMEQDLHPPVAFGILPLFAFANAGVVIGGDISAQIMAPITLGIALGLFIGKQLGVFASVWLAVKLGLARLPTGVTWQQLYGVALLCGIGFTMSLFIGSLAFEQTPEQFANQVRLGILTGTLLSAVLGYTVLRWWSKSPLVHEH